MCLLIDMGSCFVMLGGWFQCLFMYSGSSLGFLALSLSCITKPVLYICSNQDIVWPKPITDTLQNITQLQMLNTCRENTLECPICTIF